MLTFNYARSTCAMRHTLLRQVLRWLWEHHGAAKLDGAVPRVPAQRPRNVTANREIIDQLVQTPDLALRLMILLCSDLAIRSGTAIILGPRQYDANSQTLRFGTKLNEQLTMPITAAIRTLLDRCNLAEATPFIAQLHGANPHRGMFHTRFRHLLATITTKRITFHDLRRTSAVRMYEQTGDLRSVQALLGHRSMTSTIWYLDHDLVPVSRATLEIIKRPPGPERRLA